MLTDSDYRAVFEASPDAMLIVDADGVILDLNQQAVAMFGWSRDEMVGSPVERLVPAASRRVHQEHRRRYGEAPKPRPMGQGIELLALRKDGTTIPVEISLSPGKLASGRGHIICAVRDIRRWKRMRQMSKMMVAAAEGERTHIARELHDGVLPWLTRLKTDVMMLARQEDGNERMAFWAGVAGRVYDTIQRVRRTVWGLRPPELDDSGLTAALGSRFADIQDVHKFTVHATMDPVDGELDPERKLALYRIVQEAVNNAVRHAQVGEATVTIRSTDVKVVAEIRDEGCGFRLTGAGEMAGEGHLGLVSMHERAEIVGGRTVVRSSPGAGTTVRAEVPTTSAWKERGNQEGGTS